MIDYIDYIVSFAIGLIGVSFLILIFLAMIKFPMIMVGLLLVVACIIIYVTGDLIRREWKKDNGDFY